MNCRFGPLALFLVIAGLAADLAGAQPYPNRPVRLLVPYPPGAATDISARMLAARLSESLGQQVIVDNRTGASGSTMYLIAELFKAQAGIDLVHVAYKGGGPALTDVMGGQIPLCFLSTVASLPHVKAGRVRALGISSRSRSAVAPDVPTIAESGVPGFEFYLWQAMIVPAGIPQPIMTRLNNEVNAALNHAESKERLVSLGAEPTPSTPQQADAHIRAEIERWMK